MESHSEPVRSAGANQREGVASGDGVRDHRVAVEVETASAETDGGGSASTETGPATTTAAGADEPGATTAAGADGPDAAALEAEVEELRSELARRETELATVVDRYERLLERRNRAADGDATGAGAGSRAGTARGEVDWVTRTVGRAVEVLRRR